LICNIDKENIFSTFNVDSFSNLESTMELMAPSLLEYYLDTLLSVYGDNSILLNRSNIEHSINTDKYSIYHDYEDKYFFEKLESYDELMSESFF